MNKLRIVDSGVAQLTKRDKADYLRMDVPIHSNDQDRYIGSVKHGIFAVADGVGGEDHGDLAAQAACDAFYSECRSLNRAAIRDVDVLRAVQTSLLRVTHAAAQRTGGYSTFTGFYLTKHDQGAYLQVGDSSLTLYRQGEIYHITSSQHQPYHFNQLTNYIGGEHEVGPMRMAPQAGAQYSSLTEWGFVDVEDGDIYILGTDGVTSLSGGRELLDIQWKECLEKRHRTLGAQAIANRLVRISNQPDDATAVVVEFGQQK